MDRSVKIFLKITIIIGLLFLGISTGLEIKNNIDHKDYKEIIGKYVNYTEGSSSNNGKNMYKLIYEYQVDGIKYEYITDYSSSVIPKNGSKIKLKYNPSNPSYAYSKSFSIYTLFKLLGVFFIFLPLIMLISDIIWLRDILIVLFSSICLFLFIYNGLCTGAYILVLVIFTVFLFAGIMDFIKYTRKNKFKPLEDLKLYIKDSKQEKIIEKQERKLFFKSIKEKILIRRRLILLGIVFLLALPLDIFICSKGWFLNDTIYMIFSIISVIFLFVGFLIIMFAFFSSDSDIEDTLFDEKVDIKDVEKINEITKKQEKLKVNIKRALLSILFIVLFMGSLFLIAEDPLKLFSNFKKPAIIQISIIYIMIIVTNLILTKGDKISKKTIIIYLIGMILSYLYLIFVII